MALAAVSGSGEGWLVRVRGSGVEEEGLFPLSGLRAARKGIHPLR